MPVELSWSVHDFSATGIDGTDDSGRGAFAVFFDREPMAPGRDLASLAEDDNDCRPPECPNEAWFRQRFIFVTTETSVRVAALPDLRGRDSGLDRHEATIVLVNGEGRRIGESAFAREFYIGRTDERGQG